MKIQYVQNKLTADEFLMLRKSVGMHEKTFAQAQKALKNGLFSISAMHDNNIIGMGRLVGDGSMYWYIQDVAVLPEYQVKGIGKEIVLRLLEFIRANSQPGTVTTIGLMAAKGKEGFYSKLGFRSRPNENEDPGMVMNMEIGPKDHAQI